MLEETAQLGGNIIVCFKKRISFKWEGPSLQF